MDMLKRLGRQPLVALAMGGLVALGGCGPTDKPDAGAKQEAAHDHPTKGPHGGELVELGDEEYHAELLHDDQSCTVYVLDGKAAQAAPIDATEITINLFHDGAPRQLKLAAHPVAGDPAGRASRFMAEGSELLPLIDQKSALPKLSLTIDGAPYRGEIHHDHGH